MLNQIALRGGSRLFVEGGGVSLAISRDGVLAYLHRYFSRTGGGGGGGGGGRGSDPLNTR